jgi:heme exporter protein D
MTDFKLRAADQLIIWSTIAMSLVPLVPYAIEGVVL